MSRIEPTLVPVVKDLERGLRELNIPFAVVGALVPELLLDARPTRMTNDADVTVVVQSLADFETLKTRLADFGFTRTRLPHRMQHRSGGFVDLLPFSESIAPDARLQLEEGFVFNMAGFGQVVPNALPTVIEGGPTLPLAPLPLYALLKVVAFSITSKTMNADMVLSIKAKECPTNTPARTSSALTGDDSWTNHSATPLRACSTASAIRTPTSSGSLPGKRDGHLSKTKKGHKCSSTFAGIVSELGSDHDGDRPF